MPKSHEQPAKKSLRRKVVAYALVLLFLGMSLVAAAGEMGALESRVFDWIYSMPDGLRWFALVATQLGNAWMVIALVGLLFVVRWSPRLSLILFRNSVVAYLLVEIAKFIVDRPRPVLLLSEIASREIVVFGNGFPSGHTALATVMSLTLLPYLPRKFRWLPVVWIGLVAWSRIYLGVHAPLDVLGGFVLGLFVVLVADVIPWPKNKPAKSSKN